MMTLLFALPGCLTKREVQYARSTKLPEELKGFMRLAQDKVKVQVIGGDGKIGEFDAGERSTNPRYKHLSAYIVLHEQDVAKFVKDQIKLRAVMKDLDRRGYDFKKVPKHVAPSVKVPLDEPLKDPVDAPPETREKIGL